MFKVDSLFRSFYVLICVTSTDQFIKFPLTPEALRPRGGRAPFS